MRGGDTVQIRTQQNKVRKFLRLKERVEVTSTRVVVHSKYGVPSITYKRIFSRSKVSLPPSLLIDFPNPRPHHPHQLQRFYLLWGF